MKNYCRLLAVASLAIVAAACGSEDLVGDYRAEITRANTCSTLEVPRAPAALQVAITRTPDLVLTIASEPDCALDVRITDFGGVGVVDAVNNCPSPIAPASFALRAGGFWARAGSGEVRVDLTWMPSDTASGAEPICEIKDEWVLARK